MGGTVWGSAQLPDPPLPTAEEAEAEALRVARRHGDVLTYLRRLQRDLDAAEAERWKRPQTPDPRGWIGLRAYLETELAARERDEAERRGRALLKRITQPTLSEYQAAAIIGIVGAEGRTDAHPLNAVLRAMPEGKWHRGRTAPKSRHRKLRSCFLAWGWLRDGEEYKGAVRAELEAEARVWHGGDPPVEPPDGRDR